MTENIIVVSVSQGAALHCAELLGYQGAKLAWPGCAMGGYRADLIVLANWNPITGVESQWFHERLRCRLGPEGRMVNVTVSEWAP